MSGGIDSPVAAYRMMQRGCRVDFVHFSGAPYTSRASVDKAHDLVEHLTRYQLRSDLWVVPFGEVTWARSAPGGIPVSTAMRAAPKTVCATMRWATSGASPTAAPAAPSASRKY